MSRWTISPDTPLDELWARWVTETATERDRQTNNLYLTTYGATHFTPFFRTLGAITSARAADHIRLRLGKVKKQTVDKELSSLRRFLAWCEEQGYVEWAPFVPKTPRRSIDRVRSASSRQANGAHARGGTSDHRRATEYSESRRVTAFVVRQRFVVAFETALRPETLDLLSVPEHYVRGATALTITDEMDKARFGRVIPLTDEARAALDAMCPEAGLIFGRHDYRDQLKKAAAGVLDSQRAAKFTAYDLRHLWLTQLAEAWNILGATYLAGHKRATTTDPYLRPNRQAGQRALVAVGATGFTAPRANPARERKHLAGVGRSANALSLCEGGDLNPHGNNPASTSS